MANVVDSNSSDWGKKLWLPAIFSYMFMAYACHLLYSEYHHFVLKRLEYLIEGDPDTAPQTHFTIMLEHVPIPLQSKPALRAFFEKLFPGHVTTAPGMLQVHRVFSVSCRSNIQCGYYAGFEHSGSIVHTAI